MNGSEIEAFDLPSWLGYQLPSDPDPQPHTCEHCRRILIHPVTNPRRVSFRCRLPHSLRDGYIAARAGCPLFKAFIAARLRYLRNHATDDLFDLSEIGRRSPSDKSRETYMSDFEQSSIVAYIEGYSKRPFSLYVSRHWGALYVTRYWGVQLRSIGSWPEVGLDLTYTAGEDTLFIF
jgi:hypothetical protein